MFVLPSFEYSSTSINHSDGRIDSLDDIYEKKLRLQLIDSTIIRGALLVWMPFERQFCGVRNEVNVCCIYVNFL